MPGEPDYANNIERLLAHLDADSFAAQLVQAYQAADEGCRAESVKAVLAERLKQVRTKLDGTTD